MKKIQFHAQFKIHPGKEDEFKDLIPQCIEQVKANETGAEQYEWYFNSTGKVCHVLETYTNSKALLAHVANINKLLEKAFSMADFEGNIYGNLSSELQEMISKLPITNYSLYQSL